MKKDPQGTLKLELNLMDKAFWQSLCDNGIMEERTGDAVLRLTGETNAREHIKVQIQEAISPSQVNHIITSMSKENPRADIQNPELNQFMTDTSMHFLFTDSWILLGTAIVDHASVPIMIIQNPLGISWFRTVTPQDTEMFLKRKMQSTRVAAALN